MSLVSPILAVCTYRGNVEPEWYCIATWSVAALIAFGLLLSLLSQFFPKLQTMDLLGWLKAWYKGE